MKHLGHAAVALKAEPASPQDELARACAQTDLQAFVDSGFVSARKVEIIVYDAAGRRLAQWLHMAGEGQG